MTSEELRKVRAFEKEHLPEIPAEIYPRYHVTGGVGWINDPNGFGLFRGEYHLFYQYHPYSLDWGPMHWGHVKSRDLIRWERLPAVLAPDRFYDGAGCYSGSAVETPEGKHLLMYTGVRKSPDPVTGEPREYQTQCVALGDGVDYEKYDGNPVIGAELLPPGGSDRDFRDPKLWREGDTYYCVTGDRCPDGSGAILLFESPDALHWTYDGVLSSCRDRYGRMWECPDFFPLDGKHVLLVSPQEMKAQGLEFIDGNGTLCQIGTYLPGEHRLTEEHMQAIDYGLDFYATQTTLAADGRRIMIAWMQFWGSIGAKPEGLPFFGQMTVPRELHVRDGRLIQNPVRELEAYRGARTVCTDLPLSGERELPGVRGRCADLTVTVRPEGKGYSVFRLTVAKGGGLGTEITYRPGSGSILVDRRKSGSPPAAVDIRAFPAGERDGAIRLRVLLDLYSFEIFVNDGEQAASFTVYTPQAADGIAFFAEGTARIDVEKYDLEF